MPTPRVLERCVSVAVEEASEGVGCTCSEDEVDGLVSGGGLGLAPGEHDGLVGRECRVCVVGIGRDGLSELGSVEHGGVRTLSAGNGDVGGVTEERDARGSQPLVSVRELVDASKDGGGVAIGNEAVSSGAQPSNSAAIRVRVASGRPKSMRVNQSSGRGTTT